MSQIHNILTRVTLVTATCRGNTGVRVFPHFRPHQEFSMAVVTFVSYDGEKFEATLKEGQSLMQVAVNDAIPGIDGDCGGEAACGTCHVVVDPQWSETVGLSSPEEEEMLSMNPERQPTSRLSCQMAVSAAWDGLTVELPEFQM
jgi:2Fe-2S ferredoxin